MLVEDNYVIRTLSNRRVGGIHGGSTQFEDNIPQPVGDVMTVRSVMRTGSREDCINFDAGGVARRQHGVHVPLDARMLTRSPSTRKERLCWQVVSAIGRKMLDRARVRGDG